MPPPLTWHICPIIVNFLSLIVTAYVLSQYKGHWLLNDALNCAISISLKFRIKPKNAPSFQTLMEKDSCVALMLIYLASNIRKDVYIVLDSFLSFLRKYEE